MTMIMHECTPNHAFSHESTNWMDMVHLSNACEMVKFTCVHACIHMLFHMLSQMDNKCPLLQRMRNGQIHMRLRAIAHVNRTELMQWAS